MTETLIDVNSADFNKIIDKKIADKVADKVAEIQLAHAHIMYEQLIDSYYQLVDLNKKIKGINETIVSTEVFNEKIKKVISTMKKIVEEKQNQSNLKIDQILSAIKDLKN